MLDMQYSLYSGFLRYVMKIVSSKKTSMLEARLQFRSACIFTEEIKYCHGCLLASSPAAYLILDYIGIC